MSDGAHRGCDRPQAAPNTYVEPLEKRKFAGLNLTLRKKRKHEAAVKSLLIACLLAFALWPETAEAQACPGINRTLMPMGHEQITVSTTAVGFTASQLNRQEHQAVVAIVSVQTNAVRFRDDGVAPTASVGQTAGSDSVVVVCGRFSVLGIKFIRSGAADATLDVTYYEYQR